MRSTKRNDSFWRTKGDTKNIRVGKMQNPLNQGASRCYWGPSGPKCRVYKYRVGNKICSRNKYKPITKKKKKRSTRRRTRKSKRKREKKTRRKRGGGKATGATDEISKRAVEWRKKDDKRYTVWLSEKLKEAVRLKAQEILKLHRAMELEYDQKTEHGKKQGVQFP